MVKSSTKNTRVILVTGAGSGIGAAVCKRMAGDNTHIFMHTGSNREGLEKVAADCETSGATTEIFVGDLTVTKTTDGISQAIAKRGALDVLVSNAGVPEWRPLGKLDETGFRKSFDITQIALFRLVTSSLDLLKQSRAGRVIAVGSFLAHRFELGGDYVPASATVKAGLEAFVKSLAAQLAPDNITVNTIVPGYIKKDSPTHKPQSEEGMKRILDRVPAGRLGLPDEVAALATFLASEDADYITGQSIGIDGGVTL